MALADFVGNTKGTVTLLLPKLEKGRITYSRESVKVKDSDTNGITVTRTESSGEKRTHYLPWAHVVGLRKED